MYSGVLSRALFAVLCALFSIDIVTSCCNLCAEDDGINSSQYSDNCSRRMAGTKAILPIIQSDPTDLDAHTSNNTCD